MNVRKAHKIWIEQCEAAFPAVSVDQEIADCDHAWHFVNEYRATKRFSMRRGSRHNLEDFKYDRKNVMS